MAVAQEFDRSVTAIIATYNRARYIGEAIDSIFGQQEPPGQLIVVDDGSEDDTAAVVAGYGHRVEYLRKDNGGKSTAINVGLGHARNRWVWLFDDDDIALPGATRTLLDALQANPDSSFAFSGQIVADMDGAGKLTVRRTIVPRIERPEALLLELLQSYRFQMQSMLIDREALCRVGAMDERFLRGQDYELMIRLARNLQGVQVSEPTFIWRQHSGERGPKQLRHADADRDTLWRRFEMMLGRDIRTQLALGEYLVPPRRDDELRDSERTGALFNRAAIMATKGLVEEFADDLQAAAATVNADRPLTPEERRFMLAAVFSQRFTSRFAEARESSMASVVSLPGTGMVREVQACVSRALLYEARRGQRDRASRAGLFGCALALTRRAGLRASMRIWRR